MATHRLPPVAPPPKRRAGIATLMFGILVVAVAGAVALSIALTQGRFDAARVETATVEQQRDATAAQGAALAAQVQEACTSGALSGPVCQRAAQVAADPIAGPVGPRGEVGPGPTAEQIRAAVEAYLLLNPPPQGRAPTTAEVAAAVTDYLFANPPEPGRPPTASEIAAAVRLYFDTNPPEPGPQGEPGRPPTADEIRAAVDAYLAENPPDAGPMGEPGPQGVGVQSVRAEDRDGQCVLVFQLLDPADGSTIDVVVDVPNGVCDGGPLGVG